ncbi:UAA transporter [Phanerochaete sordida]|uniref:UAA transporter n=1 Tax=Phanerochaete sordida TaxID=48140 RepID=A0A9P3L7T7_9APHY|nr:UAA transporter [Phanerochaete sordida]
MLSDISLALISDWATTLTLIFGGCCSNALTLEQLTSHYPNSGSLITFAQFLAISIHGLPKFIVFTPYPKLRPRRIPLLPYLVQVALFYAVSLLNNAAFAYRIPMAVHIIFRSGGLVINMIMGYLLRGKRYSPSQIASVLLVTAGVILTTLSASKPKPAKTSQLTGQAAPDHTKTYVLGISILTLALVLSGFLGMVQDKTFATYVRNAPPSAKDAEGKAPVEQPPAWQESMFYLHLLSMPMFYFLRDDLVSQFTALNASPTMQLVVPTPLPLAAPSRGDIYTASNASVPLANLASISLPSGYVPLVLNTLTQIVCVAGVHRLTARVSSLTVTLVLVVRKAVSLLISVLMFGSRGVEEPGSRAMMWVGAAMVLVGTVAYSLASRGPPKVEEKVKRE